MISATKTAPTPRSEWEDIKQDMKVFGSRLVYALYGTKERAEITMAIGFGLIVLSTLANLYVTSTLKACAV